MRNPTYGVSMYVSGRNRQQRANRANPRVHNQGLRQVAAALTAGDSNSDITFVKFGHLDW